MVYTLSNGGVLFATIVILILILMTLGSITVMFSGAVDKYWEKRREADREERRWVQTCHKHGVLPPGYTLHKLGADSRAYSTTSGEWS